MELSFNSIYKIMENNNISDAYIELLKDNIDNIPREQIVKILSLAALLIEREELEYQRNSAYRLLCNVGLAFAKTIEISKIEKVDRNELKQLYKYGVIQFEELKDKD